MAWTLNWWAVIVSALIYFLLGWLWFSPVVFAKPWMAMRNFSAESMEQGRKRMPALMGGAAAVALILAIAMGVLVHKLNITAPWGAIKLGATVGIGLFAAPTFTGYSFQGQPLKLWAIESGYPVLGMIIVAVVQALWW